MFFSLHPTYIAGGLISWIVNPGVQWHMLKKKIKTHHALSFDQLFQCFTVRE